MRRLLPVISLAALVACAPPAMTPEKKEAVCGPRPSLTEAEAAVRHYVDNSGLKDPMSAVTRNVRVLGRGGIKNGLIHGGEWYFGWVVAFDLNAKNSYGAYVGFSTHYLVWNNNAWKWLNSPIAGAQPPAPAMLD